MSQYAIGANIPTFIPTMDHYVWGVENKGFHRNPL
jgi:hypothetical protein